MINMNSFLCSELNSMESFGEVDIIILLIIRYVTGSRKRQPLISLLKGHVFSVFLLRFNLQSHLKVDLYEHIKYSKVGKA